MILWNEIDQPIEVSEQEVVLAGKFSGILENLEPEVYHRTPYASNSFLNEAHNKSFRHAHYARTHGSEPTPAQEFGTLFHMALLEPKRFSETYVCAPKLEDHPGALVTLPDLKQRCEKLGLPVSGNKEQLSTRIVEKDPFAVIWDWKLRDCAIGKQMIDPEDADKIERMVASVLLIPDAERALRHARSQFEVSAFAADGFIAPVKARFDGVRFDKHVIVDVKTTENASFDAFQRDVRKYGYHRQTALYLDLYNHLMGTKTDLFLHICVEKKAPFEAAVYALDDATIEAGRAEYRHLLAQYAECEKLGQWPGYSRQIQTMNLLTF